VFPLSLVLPLLVYFVIPVNWAPVPALMIYTPRHIARSIISIHVDEGNGLWHNGLRSACLSEGPIAFENIELEYDDLCANFFSRIDPEVA
jgi:hypothetical protein